MADITISQLPTQTDIDESVYIPVESVTKGTRKYPIGSLISEFDTDIDRLEQAIDAVDDISQQAIPLMSQDTRGGAKLRQNGGLEIIDGGLEVDLTNESDGEVAGPIAALTAEGWAEQDSTTGKNLLPRMTASTTMVNVTCTVNLDGSITLNGTSTDGVVFYTPNMTLAQGTYTLSGCPSGGGIDSYQLDMRQGSVGMGYSDIGDGVMFTLEEETTCRVGLRIVSGYVFSNLTFYPQLELGSTATEYEPYTGGAPSPSPDYPQEIRVSSGRNLIDVSSFIESGQGNITRIKTSDGGYLVSKSGSSSATGIIFWEDTSNPIELLDDGILALNNTDAVRFDFVLHNTDGTTITIASSSVTTNKTKVVPKGTYSKISGNFGSSEGSVTLYPQLELGSIPTPYIPYGYVGLEVQGKNLYNNAAATANRYLDVNGAVQSSNNWRLSDYIPVVGGESLKISGYSSSGSVYHAYYTKDLSFISAVSTTHSSVLTVPSNASYVRISVYSSKAATTQLERGSTATEYEPYYYTTTLIPLPSRGWVGSLPDDTADKLTLDGAGKVTWEEKTNKVVFDGSSDEGWGMVSGSGRVNSAALVGTTKANVNNNAGFSKGVCSHYKLLNNGGTATSGALGWVIGTDKKLLIRDEEHGTTTSLATYTTWLSEHPIIILYPLATPVTEEAGYVDLPDIPSDATISIPELDALNVEYFIDNSVTKLISQWKERLDSKDLADIEDAVGDLTSVVANLVTHDLFYFGYDEVNGKQMISIFKRGDI